MSGATAGARRRAAGDLTRERVLGAAADVFSERGFDGTSMREIAERVGVTQPLLNYHFRTKDDLWRAAVDGLFAELTEAMAARTEGLRGVDQVTTARLLVREFVTFSARRPQLHRLITQECKVDGPRMDWLVDRHVRPLYEAVVDLVTPLVEQGRLPPIAPAHLYYVITGAAPTIFVLGPELRRLTGLDPTADEVVEAHADAVCLLLFGR